MSQCDRVLEHIKVHGSITPREADNMFGIMRLGARIYDLRCRGYRIDMEWQTAPNRFGEQTRFARYVYRGSDE